MLLKTNELTAKGFLKKLAGFSAASWISAAIGILITPIITRIFIPETIGKINLFITYMTFFQVVCTLSLDQAFMRFYNEDLPGLNKQNILRYCLRINMGLGLLSCVIILCSYNYFNAQIASTNGFFVPVCLCIVVLCCTFMRMCSISSRMEKDLFQYTIQIVSLTVVEKVLYTLVGFYRPTFQAAILSITIGFVIMSIIIFFMKRKSSLSTVGFVPKETAKVLLSFAIPYLPVLLLSWLNNSIPLFTLKKYVDYASIGVYTNAVTIANILTIIQTGFSAYWAPFIYEYHNTDKEKILKIERCIVFVLIFAAIMIVLFQDVIYLLIGESFRASKIFFPFLMLTPICSCIADMTGVGIMLSKKSYLNIFTFLGSTFTNFLLASLLIPKIGVIGAGISVAVSAIVMLIIRSFLGGKYYKVYKSIWFVILSIVLMCIACLVNLFLSGEIIIKSIFLFIILLVLIFYYRQEMRYFIQLLKRQFSSSKK